MPQLGTTTHNSIQSAVGAAYDDSTKDDCAHLDFEAGRQSFTIQYLNRPEDNEQVLNITGLDDATRSQLRRSVDFPTVDDGPNYLVLGGDSASVTDAIAEVETVVNELEADLSDVTETKSFAAAKPSLLANLKSILGV